MGKPERAFEMEWDKIEDKWALMVRRVRADCTVTRGRAGDDGVTARRDDADGSRQARDGIETPAAAPDRAKSTAE